MTKPADSEETGRIDALKSLRTTLDWLGDEVHSIQNEVDPVIEMTAVTKAFDGSKALLVENIKDYPNVRMYSNLYATPEHIAKLFSVPEYKDIKHKILDAYRKPVPTNYVESSEAPVQETVIPAKDIDRVTDILPIVLHTDEDGGRIFGSGCHLIGPPWVPDGGNTISMYRMAFRDNQQYASINMVPGGQGDVVCQRHPGKKIPVTVNCSPPVGAELMAVGTLNPVIFPGQTDKIGMAGALQDSAIGIVVQVKKQKRSDEGMQRNIMGSIMTVHRGLRLCVVVDEDIDIWEPEDVLWAIESRVSPRRDIVVYNEHGRGQAFQPSELKTGQISVADGGLGIDVTVALDQKGQLQRAVYPVVEMDFSRWFSEEQMAELRSQQDRYFKFLARTGYA